jgi:hypothetical protein
MLHVLICRTDIVTVILCVVKFGVLQQERDSDWGSVVVVDEGNICVRGGVENRGLCVAVTGLCWFCGR